MFQRLRIALEYSCDHGRRRLTFEWDASREHLVKHDAKTPKIAPCIHLLGHGLLRRHVACGAEDHTLLRCRLRAEHCRCA